MTREEIIQHARVAHDQECACGPRYLMSCGKMAAAILRAREVAPGRLEPSQVVISDAE